MKSVLFDLGNPVFKFLSTLLDLCILNILFVITCLPIFTIGTALTSIHYVMITGWDTQNMRLFGMYFKSFKQNFKQSTVVWLIMLVIGAFLGFTGWMVYQQSKVDDGIIFMIFVIIYVIMCVIYLCVVTYVWPLIAKFENDTQTTVKNAMILSLSHLPSTLIIWFMFAIAAYFIAINMLVRAFALFLLLGVLFYFQSRVFRNVFAPYLGEGERHYHGDELNYESPGVDLEHSYAESKREVAEMAAENASQTEGEEIEPEQNEQLEDVSQEETPEKELD